MSGDKRPGAARPLIVTGMHRSGTSMVASVLASCGVDMGADLLPPDAQNPLGYFEDTALLQFQRRLLDGACTTRGGWPDWGWCRTGRLDSGVIAAGKDEARRLVESRSRLAHPWGWKDPRTTMLLDLWDEILPEARYVFVYRAPWDVLDSIRRTTHPAQEKEADFALRAWAGYNFALLTFCETRRERCLLVASESVVEDTPAFLSHVGRTLGPLPSAQPAGVVRSGLLRLAGAGDPRIEESLRLAPEIESIYRRLQKSADLPARLAGVPWIDGARPVPRALSRDGARASVVIPCFNQGEFLLDAVASVEAIAGDDHELLIVDDGSDAQATLPILWHLEDRGHRVLRQPNRGLAAARNAGIRAAHGAFVLPLDADNTVGPDYLSAATARMDEEPGVGVVYGDAERFGDASGRWVMGEFDAERLARGNFIDACAVIRRAMWDELGGYDEAMPVQGWEDWDLWLRVVRSGRWAFRYVPQVLFRYRVHAASMQAVLHDAENVQKLVRYVAEKHAEFFEPQFPAIWSVLVADLVRLRRANAAAIEELAAVKFVLAARDEELASVKYVLAAHDEELASIKPVLTAREEELAALRALIERAKVPERG